jgi:hypothetical protein
MIQQALFSGISQLANAPIGRMGDAKIAARNAS